ncbi:MAG: hypothetical protein GDA40_06015 [Rhodobacteraceae bacterium]|nr:hypothetical protein [Paracoccaceae bacterium]
MSDKEDTTRIYDSIKEYCSTYNIPRENLLDILEDQKVLPMIRGKATEYIGAAVLRRVLDPRDWVVDKLNLNPQAGSLHDEDISVTYRRSGKRLKVETKNAVRGSFTMGTRKTPLPHFKVKCHKSRSHLKRATNDRYLVGDFDVLLCNVSNAIFRRNTMDRGLPLIDNANSLDWLQSHYGVKTHGELRRCSYDDWRFCLPTTIADTEGTLPRTPTVCMSEDANWFRLDRLAETLRTRIRRA